MLAMSTVGMRAGLCDADLPTRVAASRRHVRVLKRVIPPLMINRQFVSWSDTTAPPDWARRFARWDRWDTIRLSIVSKAFLLTALALLETKP